MTTTIKDSAEANNLGKQGTPSQNSAGKSAEGGRSNPVCLELSVIIRSLPSENGGMANSVRLEGRTVIVFDNGAVLRCAENLPVGQIYSLSSPNGRDVVCEVVGGRNLPSIKGYAEVQFMEAVNDFWGVHETATAPVVNAKTTEVRREGLQTAAPTEIVSPALSQETQAKSADTHPNNAPSFDDIGGLLSVPAAPAPPERKPPLPQPRLEKEPSSASTYSQSASATFGMVENLSATPTEDHAGEKNAKEAVAEALSNALASGAIPSTHASDGPASVSSSNIFSSKGMIAPSQSGPAPAALGGRLPMIGGVIALILAGAAGGAYVMHRSFDHAPVATTTTVSQPVAAQPQSAPISQALNAGPAAENDKAQLPAENVAVEQRQAATTASVIPAIVSNAGSSDSKLNRKDARNADNAADSKEQSASATPARPSMSKLKMNSPSAPKSKLVDMGAGGAPLAEMAATELPSANTSAGLLTASGRTSGQPAPPPGSIAPVPSASSIQPAGKTVAPKLIASAHLSYPPSARASNIQGTVTVMANVDDSGAVSGVKALNGPILLRQAAVDSVKQWKYSPGTVDGKPTTAQVTVAVEFKLN